MVKVGIPGASKYWVGARNQLRTAVNFARKSSALRFAAGRFARNVALAGTGYLGAAAAAAGLGYDVYRAMRNRRAKPGKRGTRVRSGRVRKYAGRGRRPRARRGFAVGRGVGRKRSAAVAFAGLRPNGAVAKRRRFVGSSGGAAKEIVLSRKKVWKVGRARRMDRQVLKLGFDKKVWRWQAMNALNSNAAQPGGLILSHATYNTTDTVCPLYVVCLNGAGGGQSANADVVKQMVVTNTGTCTFVTINGQTQTLGPSTLWQLEYQHDASADLSRYIMQAWYDIRMNCYGAIKQPTLYDVRLVSFLDDYLDPFESSGFNTDETRDRNAYWQSMVHSYMSNPLVPALKNKKFGVRTHGKFSFVIQPSLTIEQDATPANRLVRIFVKDGCIYDYSRFGVPFTAAGADNDLDTVKYLQEGSTGGALAYPVTKARKFLIIRAMNTTRTEDNNVNYTPTFDLMIRKCEYVQTE